MGERVTVCEVGLQMGSGCPAPARPARWPARADLDRPVAARAYLQEGLPDEPRHGAVARAGLPRTFGVVA